MVRCQNCWIFDISAIMLIYVNYGNYKKCSIVIIRHPAVSSHWGPIQLIFVIRALHGYLPFPCSLCAIQANSKLWCYLAAILDLCELGMVIHDWLSFNHLLWQSKLRYRHQNRFSKWYGSKTIGYLIVLQLCWFMLICQMFNICPLIMLIFANYGNNKKCST